MFNNRGQIRILEAFLSVAVIFLALIPSVTFPSSPNLQKQKSLENIGMQAMIGLDANGTLGILIDERSWSAIHDSLNVLLPEGISFNLTIYDENMAQINTQFIRNSNLLGSEVVSVQYVCASQNPNDHTYVRRLQLAWTGLGE